MGGPENRKSARVSVNLKVNLQLPDREAFEERFAQNISKTGIFIHTKEPVPVGSKVSFEYNLADDSRIMRGFGLVRWVRTVEQAEEPDSPPGMGLEFVDVDADTEELITEMVARFGEGDLAPQRKSKVAETPIPSTEPPAPVARIDDSMLGLEEFGVLSALGEDLSTPDAAPPVGAEPSTSQQPAEIDVEVPESEALPEIEVDIPEPEPEPEPVALPEIEVDVPEPDEAVPGIAADAHEPAESLPEIAVGVPESDALSEIEVETPEPETLPEITVDASEQGPDADVDAVLDEGPAADQIPDALWIDLCDANVVTICTRAGTISDPSTSIPGFAIVDNKVRLNPEGPLLAHVASWLTDGWPTAQHRVRARWLGLSLADGAEQPSVVLEGHPMPLDLALRAMLQLSIKQHCEDRASIPAVARVIVPAITSAHGRGLVEATLTHVGIENVILLDDARCALFAAGVEAHGDSAAVVIQTSDFETRVTLSGVTGMSGRTMVDTHMAAVNQRLEALGELALLREHGTDVEDDPSLRAALREQVASSGAQGLALNIAGCEVTRSIEQVAGALTPMTDRVVLAIDDILDAAGISPAEVAASVVLGPVWPGLVEQLGTYFGRAPTTLEGRPGQRFDHWLSEVG